MESPTLTKKCSVALEHLDEKSLYRCLQKYGLRLGTHSRIELSSTDSRFNSKTDPKTCKPKKRKRKKINFVLKLNLARNKRKLKPLVYSDDESYDEKNEQSEDLSQLSESAVELGIDKTSDSEPKLGDGDKILTKSMGWPESVVRKEKVQKSVEATLLKNAVLPHEEESICTETDKRPVSDGEIEIIEVRKQLSGNSGERKNQLIIDSDERVPEEDEYDSREDSEDDRHTVIFEEELQKDTDLEVKEEKEIIGKKFNNREITNRKKRRLAKFKRKSLIGRNLAKVERKQKNKLTEASCGEEEPPEKSGECINEECLREVSCLVKRLAELSKIISLLQRERPTNGELDIHFASVINAQQENFHWEIRKSQKTIIRCYERMLSLYKDTARVAWEIGKRSSLSVEDVVNVISLCIHIEGQCETEKSQSASQQVFPTSVPSTDLRKLICGNLVRTVRGNLTQREIGAPKQQTIKNSSCMPPSQLPRQQCFDGAAVLPRSKHNVPPDHVNYHSKLAQRPSDATLQQPTRRHVSPLNSSYRVAEDRNHEFLARWTTSRTPQSCHSAPRSKDSGTGQLLQQKLLSQTSLSTNLVRRPTLQKPTKQQPTNPIMYDGTPVRTQTSAHCSNQSDGPPQRWSIPPLSSAPGNISNLALRILVPANRRSLLLNRAENNKNSNNTNKIARNLRGDVRPAQIPNRSVVHPSQQTYNLQHTTNSIEECPAGTNVMVSVRVLDDNRLFVTPTKLHGNAADEATECTGEVVKEVLDPTVPQKLTMKNSRLQAGPVLSFEDGGTKTTEKTPCNEFSNWNREDSNSRVYVCAQHDCKNPGVRICNGCHSVIYCSENCQFKHWTLKHKAECYQLKALRE